MEIISSQLVRHAAILIAGYDPQLLLSDLRGEMLWAQDLLELYRKAFPDITEFFTKDWLGDEMIDFEPRFREESILFVAPSGEVVDVRHFLVPVEGRLTPFVKPLERTPTGRYRSAIETGNEYHRRMIRDNGVAYITKDHMFVEFVDLDNIDFSKIEERLLTTREFHNEQLMVYALGAEFLGENYKPKIVFKAAIKPPPSYLAHDPTKQHKRRRK